jgi:hypothetical protein
MDYSLLRRFTYLLVLVVYTFPLAALTSPGEEAKISLLTCSPSDEAVFTVYGHTAIRVCDPAAKVDIVFNYGIFDFNTSNFVYRFVKGETDYKLGISTFETFLAEYGMRGSGVREQVLNFMPEEKKRIWEALRINALPENVTYRYNFFFDNCATRPATLIENCVTGKVVYHHEPAHKTFRELINYFMRNQPWLVFGCQLVLGSPTDRIATRHEELFLPLLLEKAFDKATIVSPEGQERPLISAKNILLKDYPEVVGKTIFTPWIISLICLLITILITLWEWWKKAYCWPVDYILFTLAGLSGTVLFFLAFVSEHPATWPNWLIIGLHPFHLLGVVFFAVKKLGKIAYCYHFINFAALTLMLLSWYFVPQHFHIALIPLIVCLWTRSGRYVLSKYN